MEAILTISQSLGGGNRTEIYAAKKRQARANTKFFHLLVNRVVRREKNNTSSTATYTMRL